MIQPIDLDRSHAPAWERSPGRSASGSSRGLEDRWCSSRSLLHCWWAGFWEGIVHHPLTLERRRSVPTLERGNDPKSFLIIKLYFTAAKHYWFCDIDRDDWVFFLLYHSSILPSKLQVLASVILTFTILPIYFLSALTLTNFMVSV